MKIKYIEANSEKKYPKRVIGIELTSDKETTSIIGVDMSDCDDIDVFDLDKDEYKFSAAERDRVEHLFTVATLERQSALNEATIRLMSAKRNLNFAESKLKQYFKKDAASAKLEVSP